MIQKIKLLIPEAVEYFEIRYSILKLIAQNEPMGRRAISKELDLPERKVRNELLNLENLGYLITTTRGMSITNNGKRVLIDLKDIAEEIYLFDELAEKIESILKIDKCLISDFSITSEFGKREIANLVSKEILSNLKENSILGITGGRTMNIISEGLKTDRKYPNVIVVPARGSIGRRLEDQADSVAYKIANKLGAENLNMQIPDTLDDDFLKTLRYDPEIGRAMDYLTRLDILVMGIGRADNMGRKRQLRELETRYLLEKKAVSEAFGSYYDIKGNSVLESDSLLDIKDFKNIPKVIEIAGGKDKAQAVISFTRVRNDISLILDKDCADEILSCVGNENKLLNNI